MYVQKRPQLMFVLIETFHHFQEVVLIKDREIKEKKESLLPTYLFSLYIFIVAFRTAFCVKQNTRASTTPCVAATTSFEPPGGKERSTPGVRATNNSAK